MQHRGRRWCGGVSFRRPGVKREERDQNSETDVQEQINMALRFRTDLPRRRRSLQLANVETARRDWNALIKQDQTDEQNETSESEIDRDLPRSCAPVPAAPNSDQQKSWDKREF